MAIPNGHFYSPVVDPAEAARDRARIWPERPEAPAGIDWRDDHHERLLREVFPGHLAGYDYADRPAEAPGKFVSWNDAFEWMDAKTYFAQLLRHRPKKIVEVGSGYSTLLAADVCARHLGGTRIVAVEPYPPPYLDASPPAGVTLLRARVQDVPASLLSALDPGDMLFVDSSHVSKTGSDVNKLIFEVVPRLAPGVVVHFHDIFLPWDYPEAWVQRGQSWNEQYLVRALLMGGGVFQVDFGCAYARWRFPELVKSCYGPPEHAGGSLWLIKS